MQLRQAVVRAVLQQRPKKIFHARTIFDRVAKQEGFRDELLSLVMHACALHCTPLGMGYFSRAPMSSGRQ